MEVVPEPVQLIGIDDEGKCHLQEDGLAVLRKITGKLAVVGIAGLYRTGKSFLLNRLLGQQTGFQTGPTVNACTKGIWIWGRPIELSPECQCVLLDTEGLGSAQRTASCDMQILSLCILLSSYFIYNSMGAIDEQGIDDLHLVLHLAKHIRTKSGPEENGAGAKGGSNSELAGHFPTFLWVLRDFHLRLEDENGNPILEKDYLEGALESIPGQDDKNKVRDTIKDLFRDRGCATLVRPAVDEGELRHLQCVAYDTLRPKFRAQVEAFVARVYAEVKPKTVEGKPVSGAMLANIAAEYCKAINNSTVPTIQSAWFSAVQQQLRQCEKEAVEIYQTELQSTVERLPVGEECLHEVHKAAKARAMAVFSAQKFDEGDPKFQEYRGELARKIKMLYESVKVDNADASLRQCESVAEELYGSLVGGKLDAKGAYASMDELMQDWEQLREAYMRQTDGPAQSDVLSTLLFQRMSASVQRLTEELRDEADKHRRVKEKCDSADKAELAPKSAGCLDELRSDMNQRVAALEQRLRVAEAREGSSESSAPRPEGHAVPLLTEHARRYREAAVERHTRIWAAERFHLEVVAAQWRLDALDTQLRAADAAVYAGSSRAAASSAEGPSGGEDEKARRRTALQETLEEIQKQQVAAVGAFEERAARDALLLPPDASGRMERLPLSDSEREAALEKLRAAAAETFAEIEAEANAILKVKGDAGLGHLRAALRRRREFWQEQLEETWAAWQDTARKMRLAGELATRSWLEVAGIAEDTFQRWRADRKPLSNALLRAFAACVAQGIEVELLHASGLSGLQDGAGASRSSASSPGAWLDAAPKAGAPGAAAAVGSFSPPPRSVGQGFSEQARLATLSSAMKMLRAAEAQHRVGETVLSRALAPGGVLAAAGTPDSALSAPVLTTQVVASAFAMLADSSAVDASGCEASVALWLLEGLVEATCEAARGGSIRRVRALLELCTALGGLPLAEAVRGAGSQKSGHRGATPLEIASANSHPAVAELLREWPNVEQLKLAGIPGASCLQGLVGLDDLDGISADGARVRKRDVFRAKMKGVFSMFSSRAAD